MKTKQLSRSVYRLKMYLKRKKCRKPVRTSVVSYNWYHLASIETDKDMIKFIINKNKAHAKLYWF